LAALLRARNHQWEFSYSSCQYSSLGIILYALVTASFHFTGTDKASLAARIIEDEVVFPCDVSPAIRNLILEIVEKDNRKRITLAEIAAHGWMNERIETVFTQLRLNCFPSAMALKLPMPQSLSLFSHGSET
jgi:serine/threonine protein kinase